MSHNFEDVLNDCLEKMAGGEDIEACIQRHPQYREELLPLLETAQTTANAVNKISYTVEARQRGLDRVMQAYSDGRMNARSRRISAPFLSPLARPILVGFVAVFLTAIAAGGSTMAAADSVPGEPLYWVKKTRENVTLMMPSSDIEKAERHARLASVRAQEIDRLIERNQMLEAERMTRLIEHHLNQAASYAGLALFYDPLDMPRRPARHNVTGLRMELERDARLLRVRLGHHMNGAPTGRRVRIVRIMHKSDLDYHIVINAMSDDRSLFWRNQSERIGLR